MTTGKCPKCEKVVTAVRIEDVTVRVGVQPQWKGVSYCCPWCNTVLGVQIDPVALKTDIIEGVVGALRGRSG